MRITACLVLSLSLTATALPTLIKPHSASGLVLRQLTGHEGHDHAGAEGTGSVSALNGDEGEDPLALAGEADAAQGQGQKGPPAGQAGDEDEEAGSGFGQGQQQSGAPSGQAGADEEQGGRGQQQGQSGPPSGAGAEKSEQGGSGGRQEGGGRGGSFALKGAEGGAGKKPCPKGQEGAGAGEGPPEGAGPPPDGAAAGPPDDIDEEEPLGDAAEESPAEETPADPVIDDISDETESGSGNPGDLPDIADSSAADDTGGAAVEAAVDVDESSGPASQRNNKLPAETDTPYSVEDGDEEMGSGALKSAASAVTSLLLVGSFFALA